MQHTCSTYIAHTDYTVNRCTRLKQTIPRYRYVAMYACNVCRICAHGNYANIYKSIRVSNFVTVTIKKIFLNKALFDCQVSYTCCYTTGDYVLYCIYPSIDISRNIISSYVNAVSIETRKVSNVHTVKLKRSVQIEAVIAD